MANPIQATSELYKNLCTAYREKDKRVRFESCYTLTDEASYEEIHYVISMLKEAGFDEDLPDISIGSLSISNIMKGLKSFIGTEVVMRKAFLLDINSSRLKTNRPPPIRSGGPCLSFVFV